LGLGREQALLFVLAVDVAEQRGEFPKQGGGRRAAAGPSSVSMPAPARIALNSSSSGTSKMPEIRARSAPVRIMSADARPPNSRASASTTMDLPEPVSPVSRFRPRWKRTRRCSMTA